jgi:CO/xanthine dehydrogenase Mo-binding subunit
MTLAMAKDQVGRSVPRLESEAKVTGTAEYIHNLELPGMLYGAIVRSEFPHARLHGIDASAALAVQGVTRVVTADDVREVTAAERYGPAFWDQPVLATGKVRHVGEAVAVVLAWSPSAAAAAAERVEVSYDELPAVFDEVEAAGPGAPVVHERIEASSLFADLKQLGDRENTNVNLHYKLRRGDVEAGFAAADRVFEHTFTTPATAHAPMEPLVSVAEPGAGSSIVVHSATQNPSEVRTELARLFGVPENKVRIRTAFLGGGFGGKLYPRLEPIAAVCARLSGRPVRIALTMDEQFTNLTRHATTSRLRTGVRADGTIIARQCDIWWNSGAYADIGPRVTQKTGMTAAGPYDIENVSINSYNVYTNLPPAGAFRGFGVPQVAWAYESQADIIAAELGIDPLEFRLRNLLRNNRPHATGTVLRDTGTEEVLGELRRELRWDEPFQRGEGARRRGRGLAIGIKAVITPSTSAAIVSLGPDASCTVYCGTADMGQGSDTAMAQVAAEVLGLAAEDVAVIHPDTAVTPYDMGTLGSRSTYHMGHAVRKAALEVRRQLLEMAAAQTGTEPGELEIRQAEVISRAGHQMPLGEVIAAHFGMRAGNIIGSGAHTPAYAKPDPATGQSPGITAFWMVGGVGAEVTVDTATGALTVDRLVTAGDVGHAINPEVVRTQLTGAAVMQLGMTLSEQLQYEDGQVTNTGLGNYKVPGILDVPVRMDAVVVEFPGGDAPFGAKGAGETGTFAVSPAVANAVHDAVGVRVRDLPLTAERIWRLLRAADHVPHGSQL